MKIDCISDLHGFCPELPGGDLLIVAGDLTEQNTMKEYVLFNAWIMKQDYKKKIIISGNHDGMLQRELIPKDVFYGAEYLQDSGTEFEGLKIWGSPWTLWFYGINPLCKAFTKKTDQDIAKKWALIPKDVDILITHMPAYGILDKTDRGDCVGSRSLLSRLTNDCRPYLHVFGHIHECYGVTEVFADRDENKMIKSVNASIMDEVYCPWHKPIRIEL